jgi:hypothetical protein
MQFTEIRFRPDLQAPAQRNTVQTANRLRAGAAAPAGNTVDQQMDAWLKEARGNIKIQFKKEAFQ